MLGTPEIKTMTRVMLDEMIDIELEIRERKLAGETVTGETQLNL